MADFKVNPQPWMRDAVRVADDKLVKQIADDFRSYNASPRSPLSSPPQTVSVVGAGRVVGGDDAPVAGTGSGWADSPELKPPPGIDLIDEMCAQADLADRAERIRALAQTAAIQRAEAELAKQSEPKERKDKGK
jgi:hypothetical protein